MNSDIIILIVFIALPILYTLKKINARKYLNVIDVYYPFLLLYYIIVPIRCALVGISYRGMAVVDMLNRSEEPLFYLCLYVYFLLFLNYVIDSNKRKSLSFLNVGKNIARFAERFKSNPKVIFVYIACLLFVLYSETNYSALTADNIELQRTWGTGENIGLFEQLLTGFVKTGFPVYTILIVKYIIDIQSKKYKIWAKIAAVLAILCLLLGSRTQMTVSLTFLLFYIYSCYAAKIRVKHIIISLCSFVFLSSVIFPLSQSFRDLTHSMVERGANHSFSDVLSVYAFMSSADKDKILKAADTQTKERSMNVYVAYYESFENIYHHTDGAFFLDQLSCLIPIVKPSKALDNFCAELLEGGGDIAESALTVFNVDAGILGIFVILPVFFLINFGMITLMTNYAYKFFKCPEISFISIIYILSNCVEIEKCPSLRELYNPTLITIVMFGCVLSLFYRKVAR